MKDQGTDSSRYKQIDQLLDAALDLAPDQRPAFLDRECAGDESLRQEIERLLISDQRARTFFESPAFAATAEQPGTSRLLSLLRAEPEREALLHSGRQIAGRYQILSRLGKGGMAEVWHAFDLKLRVNLALKTLRLDLNQSPEERVEFIRHEIRTAREVNSPNVCRIFDLVSEGDQELISMEYIDGITLMEMLEQKGPLTTRHAMDIASQFLTGLEAIHSNGLVHRDLKPENIMITRTGRVVVMDLGIAQYQSVVGGMIAGTHPYMSLEQLAGKELDARSDIFAAGVVLAEMIHTRGKQSKGTRENIWKAVRRDPMQLPDSPWKSAILRAVAENREARFESATALARALEDTTLRVETIEDQNPYPGLASFTTDNSGYFFGREQEVEALLQKLRQLYLMALIGPSGAGKTSFLQAGLLPVLPKEWCCVVTHPGDGPLANLAQSLAPLLAADPEAIAKMIRFEDPEVAVRIFSRLRERHAEFVLIVDRFEELFTLNSFAVQKQFVEILGRAPLEANIRVLLVMRDDFLIECKAHERLAPIFSELTAMVPLKGASLRRALVQPALKCGYRFEDEGLVHDILSEVEREKGALPLMAFATSLVWEKRDRQKGQLTRAAYKEIGEVQGALARHAENIMQKIGVEKEAVVHEIFRNLVTAQNTRAARDTEELLSVFPQPEAAREVLRALINGRLLTSFVTAPAQGEQARSRVEISHESLLSNWPRLVRWLAQDAESAQLRDQLRQAAGVWNQRGRSEDLLWTGTAFLEFQLWRQRYSGGLTSTEEEFARAMARRASKRRRQRQAASVTIFIVLLLVLAAITMLWRNASVARDRALQQSRRAEAGRALAVARSLTDADPSMKLAYALRSLELADIPEARLFAMQAIAEGPQYHLLRENNLGIQMSPNGKWLAVGRGGGGVVLFPQDGSKPITVNEVDTGLGNHVPWYCQFSPDSEFLLWSWRKDLSVIKVWSISGMKLFRTFHFEGLTICFVRGGKAFFITDDRADIKTPFSWRNGIVRVWNFDREEPQVLGRVDLQDGGWKAFDIDYQARRIAYANANGIYVEELETLGKRPARMIGTGPKETWQIRFNPNGTQCATGNEKGDILLWSLDPASDPKHPLRVFSGNGSRLFDFWFDSQGESIFTAREGFVFRWDLTATQDADPMVWRKDGNGPEATVDSKHQRFVLGIGEDITFYSYTPQPWYAFHVPVTNAPGQHPSNLRFTPDGKSFISGFSEDGISVHTLPGVIPPAYRQLWNNVLWSADSIDVDPQSKYVVAPTNGNGIYLISLGDGTEEQLKGLSGDQTYHSVSISPEGKNIAALGENGIEIWNLAKGSCRILEHSEKPGISFVKYSPDGTLYSVDSAGDLRRWDLSRNSSSVLASIGGGNVNGFAISKDGQSIAYIVWSSKGSSELRIFHLQTAKSSTISSHGNRVTCMAFDEQGTKLATGDADGIVRIGPITGETPTLLLGHQSSIRDVAVDPSGKWVLSVETDNPTIRLWRMPDIRVKPLQSLSTADFLNAIRQMTNVRVVADENLPGGYKTTLEPFTSWGTAGTKQDRK